MMEPLQTIYGAYKTVKTCKLSQIEKFGSLKLDTYLSHLEDMTFDIDDDINGDNKSNDNDGEDNDDEFYSMVPFKWQLSAEKGRLGILEGFAF